MPFPLTHDDPHGFGPYRLLARLGSGGMGTVYLGRSAGGRTVAVKTMHARIAADAEFRTRFRLESDAARVIGGRYGAQVVDADPLAETPWLATEYVLGPPLDEAVERCGPLPEPAVRALGAALCGALGQLHRSDVVHRDLKPSNIMITAHGPKVIDFGIARAIGDDHLTRTGSAVGTPAFMSPEQATGEEHTPAGDVFALAGVLVFAATGRGPFGAGQPADLLYRVRHAEPDLTGVPAALAPVLARCLAKDPSHRPTTSQLAAELHDGRGEFADHLPDALLARIAERADEVWRFVPQRRPAPEGEPARPPEPATRPVAAGPSRRALLLAGAATVLGVGAAGAGTWAWLGTRASRGPGPYRTPPPGPSAAPLPRKKLDSLWQRQAQDPGDVMMPAAPLAVGDLVALAVGSGTGAVDARSGEVRWLSTQGHTWQLASDGERLYRMTEASGARRRGHRTWPLSVSTVDLATGKEDRTLPGLPEFNGILYENQLLCAADGVLYLAAGHGDEDMDAFPPGQSWHLLAVAADSGRKLWSQPLPRRPRKSLRLYFLAATAVGNRLVLLQETNEGTVRVVARDTRTGDVRWDQPLDVAGPDFLRVPLTTDAQHLYLGSGRLQALRLSDGRQVWNSGTGRPGRVYGPPAVKDGVLYAVEKGLGLVALDAGSGKTRWTERSEDGVKAAVTDRPVVGPGHVYTKGSTLLRAADRSTGRITRVYRTTGDRFIAHERSKMVIALGGHFLAAFPLQ
ncbi:protein kinase [Streptomyces sp. MST-110588]|uniref:protein kinase domain-containing protein n=1 Tax=Streptomyces sp. MST-110588 TaxID=2833628 RepID=UPI001F5D4DE0|nr:protein kinase [Streptomyces sp. MST-110588]UNO43507.1 protein kinase [Streptomyces sp. MST-110588]